MRLPEKVEIVEVGPGEGWPRERVLVPTQVKVEVIERSLAAGVREVLAVAFPRTGEAASAQTADAAAVLERLAGRGLPDGARLAARVADPDGARRALAAGAAGLSVTVPATDAYGRRVLGEERDAATAAAGAVLEVGADAGVPVTVVVAVAFGCPWSGPVAEAQVLEIVRRWAGRGAARVTLDDSAGLAGPLEAAQRGVAAASAAAQASTAASGSASGIGRLGLRLADTRAMALPNALAALHALAAPAAIASRTSHGALPAEEGLAPVLEGSAGGAGGSPAAPGAPGTVATEDLVYLCAELGVASGVDFATAARAGRRLVEILGRDLPSRTLHVEPPAAVWERLAAVNRAASGGGPTSSSPGGGGSPPR